MLDPLARSKQQHSRMQVMTQLRVLSMRIAEDERWQDGVVEALSEKLGISEATWSLIALFLQAMQREALHVSEARTRV